MNVWMLDITSIYSAVIVSKKLFKKAKADFSKQ